MRKTLFVFVSTMLAMNMLTGCGSKSTSAPTKGTTTATAARTEDTTAAVTPSADAITLKLGFSTNEEDLRARAPRKFKKEVEEKSGGGIVVEIYPTGQLGGNATLVKAMALDSGTMDVIITDASNFATHEPKMGISALPFQFEGFKDAWEFMDGGTKKEAEDLLIEQNMRVLAHYNNGFRCVTNSKKEIGAPADMASTLTRTPENPVIMAAMKTPGANPQPLAFSELYQALQQGTYDAQENPIPVIYNNNLYEAQKYLSVTSHIYSGICFAITESTWNKMSAEQQAIVDAAAKSSTEFNRQMNKQQTEKMLSTLKEKGMIITEPDLTPFAEVTTGVTDDVKATYGDLLDKVNEWKVSRRWTEQDIMGGRAEPIRPL